MPNFEPASNSAWPRADETYAPLKATTVIYAGDPVVLTSADSSKTTARAVISTDYSSSSFSPGILGFACHAATSDSSGIANAQIVPSGVSGAAAPIYNVPQYSSGLPVDVGTSRSLLRVFVANNSNSFWGKVTTASVPATAAAAQALVGKGATIVVTSATDITITPSSGTEILSIIGYDPNDLTRLKFRVKPAYQQSLTGSLYST